MREIIFRGKRTDNNEWVYGDLFHTEKDFKKVVEIIDFNKKPYTHIIDSSTVGQFTGLTDKNGSKIFEGDVFMSHVGLKMTIEWQNDYCLYMMRWLSDNYQMKTDVKFLNKSEIIGNIHDNPELL